MDLVHDLLGEWGITTVRSITVPELGTMNETWIVHWDDGSGVLRRHRHIDLNEVAFEHAVMAHARLGGVPCPTFVPTPDGRAIVGRDGRLHSMYSLAPGGHGERGRLGQRKARSMGLTLACIHNALASMGWGPPDRDGPGDVDETLRRIDRLEAAVRSRRDPDLAWALKNLHDRRRWLAANRKRPPSVVASQDEQVIHGDYQDTNVLFVGDEVTAVLDWDKARVASPIMEVVRALDHGLGLARDACAAFLDDYRSKRSLVQADVQSAVEYWTHQQAHSLWVFERLFLDNDERVARFASPRPFVPFSRRWEKVALTLS